MSQAVINCVLLAVPRYPLGEGVRDLLKTTFHSVVTVGDETSLLESAARLHPVMTIADYGLTPGQGFRWIKQLRLACPEVKLILLIDPEDETAVHLAMEQGAEGVVCRNSISTELLAAVDAVLEGKRYILAKKS
jgi:DNA-binding NarL/FixJ family response regulator